MRFDRISRPGPWLRLAVLALACGGCARAGERPNLLLVVIDTVRADAVGAALPETASAGGDSVTPHLDRIAAEGTVFRRAYANAPWTVPSHATLFTGLLPHDHGTHHGHYNLDERVQTAAEIFAAAGYATFGITTNPWLTRRGGFAQGFEAYREILPDLDGGKDKGATEATRVALGWLDQVLSEGRPFFLFVNYLEAHLPYAPPAAVLERLRQRGLVLEETRYDVARAEEIIAGARPATPEELTLARDLYLAELYYLDARFGELVAALAARDVLDRTLVAVTSDHGEQFAENGLMAHEFSLHDALLHVPLVLRYPGRVAAGRETLLPVSHLDVLPTLLDAAGLGSHAGSLPGQSLLDLAALDPARPLVAEYARPRRVIEGYWRSRHPEVDIERFDVALASLRVGPHKLVTNSRGEVRLFDTVSDPAESRDLSGALPADTAALRETLERLAGPLPPS